MELSRLAANFDSASRKNDSIWINFISRLFFCFTVFFLFVLVLFSFSACERVRCQKAQIHCKCFHSMIGKFPTNLSLSLSPLVSTHCQRPNALSDLWPTWTIPFSYFFFIYFSVTAAGAGTAAMPFSTYVLCYFLLHFFWRSFLALPLLSVK